jgi:tRNA(fMet)-specific endonuclease VapC
MKRSLVLDTDVTSRMWRNELTPHLEQELADASKFVTFVTLAEGLLGAYLANWGARRTNALRAFHARFDVLPWDDGIPPLYALLSSGSRRAGRPVGDNDCWIAATCVAHDMPLLTCNRKDFSSPVLLGLNLR